MTEHLKQKLQSLFIGKLINVEYLNENTYKHPEVEQLLPRYISLAKEMVPPESARFKNKICSWRSGEKPIRST